MLNTVRLGQTSQSSVFERDYWLQRCLQLQEWGTGTFSSKWTAGICSKYTIRKQLGNKEVSRWEFGVGKNLDFWWVWLVAVSTVWLLGYWKTLQLLQTTSPKTKVQVRLEILLQLLLHRDKGAGWWQLNCSPSFEGDALWQKLLWMISHLEKVVLFVCWKFSVSKDYRQCNTVADQHNASISCYENVEIQFLGRILTYGKNTFFTP